MSITKKTHKDTYSNDHLFFIFLAKYVMRAAKDVKMLCYW